MFKRCSISTLTSVFRVLAILSVLTTIVFVFCCVGLYSHVQHFQHGANRYVASNQSVRYNESSLAITGNNTSVIKRNIRMLVLGFEFYWSRDSLKEERDVFCPLYNITVKLKFSSDHRAIYHADITFFSHLYRLGKMKVWKDHLDKRSPNQRWALFSLEPPIRSAKNTTVPWNWQYRTHHWTATYNAESDIPFPYGKFIKYESMKNISTDIFKTKTKLAVFLSSNCNMTKWPRLRFVRIMQKYIPVDIFGKCGTIPCDWEGGCTEQLKQYKFYFALENSQCDGYISEKFWNALSRYDAVPIVWGARPKDYKLIAPNQSYIHVSNYKSIKSLGRFIMNLGSKESDYNSYHSWRKTGSIQLLPDWSTLPADDHVCATAKRYHEDMENLAAKKKTKFRNVNGEDWLESCKVGRDQVERRLPIPETQAGYVK
ncbi:hypothetical protein BSL78_23768 [Apostichopus japonicus]|uniref:Fucosyltransferase n=2 Tax=Stichopus japonicus TaxID=307972 RepID=A0A2G8JUI6_STIJA|nr:hypothetical protein BSL78_23768 [Apostichopus japonicus]